MNPAAKQYLRQVKKQLHCPRSLKNKFLQQLEDEFFLYCEENDLTDFDDLARNFGVPETVAKEFLSELDGETISKYYSHRGRLTLIAAGCLALLLLVVGIRQIYINFAFGVLKVLLVPWMLTFGESCYGLLGTFRSAGVLAGTILLAVRSIPQGKQYGVYFWTQIVFVVCIALAACMPHFWPIAVLFFIAYANQYVFNTLQRSAVIIAAPDAIRGKVICAIQALAMGFSALGNMTGGVIGEQYAPQPLLMGLMLALLVAIIFLGRNKSVRGLFSEGNA